MRALLAYLWLAVGEVLAIAIVVGSPARARRMGLLTMLACAAGALAFGAVAWRLNLGESEALHMAASLAAAALGATAAAALMMTVSARR